MEVNYYVDEKTGTTACTITNCKCMALDLVERYMFSNDEANTLYATNCLVIPNRFEGKAVCSEDDEFDLEIGKSLAYHRAKTKLDESISKAVTRYLNAVAKEYNNIIENVDSYFSALEKRSANRATHIDKMLGVVVTDDAIEDNN